MNAAAGFAPAMRAILEEVSEALGRPRVAGVHVPPVPADGTRRGEFAALALEDGALGLSYVLLDDTLATLRREHAAWQRQLAGRPAIEVARALDAAPGTARTLAWAAAQALGHALARRAGWAPPPARDSLAALDPQPGEHIGLVGLFGPLMPRLVASGARVTVVELRAELAGRHDGFEVTLDPSALQACDKVLATGTLLLNDTLEAVLAHTRRARRVAIVGPTVPLLPDVLFERGVHVAGGTWVEDPPAFLDALVAGRERAGAARKTMLVREDWPGWRALRDRL